MKQFEQFFNLPPHLVTQWVDVKALYIQDDILHVALHEGDTIRIPNLDQKTVEQIFLAYGKQMAKESSQPNIAEGILEAIQLPFPGGAIIGAEIGIELPFKVGEGYQSIVQHDSKMATAPELPKELLDKLTKMAKMMITQNPQAFREAEPHCNCFHCQVASSLGAQIADEEVKDEDLHFEPEWKVTATGTDNKRFQVTNRLNPDLCYQVHLGNPIGCTCGKNDCEHIIAALKS